MVFYQKLHSFCNCVHFIPLYLEKGSQPSNICYSMNSYRPLTARRVRMVDVYSFTINCNSDECIWTGNLCDHCNNNFVHKFSISNTSQSQCLQWNNVAHFRKIHFTLLAQILPASSASDDNCSYSSDTRCTQRGKSSTRAFFLPRSKMRIFGSGTPRQNRDFGYGLFLQ